MRTRKLYELDENLARAIEEIIKQTRERYSLSCLIMNGEHAQDMKSQYN
jgi:hypothetical protein